MIVLAGQQRRCRHEEQTFGLCWGGRGWDIWESSMETDTLPYVKQIAKGNLLLKPKGAGWGGSVKREGTSVYLRPIHDDAWQKPTQYCIAIILQLKIKFKKICKELFSLKKKRSGYVYMYIYQIHFALHLKLTHFKSYLNKQSFKKRKRDIWRMLFTWRSFQSKSGESRYL